MLEVFSEAIRPINLPFTVLLGVVVLYWSLVALGMFGIELGADADLDATGDSSADSIDGGSFSTFLTFINIGEVPITIVLSFLTLFIWVLSILVNYYWAGGSFLLGLAALVPILGVSMVLTRYSTMPFRSLLRALNRNGEERITLIGRTCMILTSEASPRGGQAQIETRGAPILINVRTVHDEPLPRGTTGLVVRKDESKDLFYVIPVTSDKLE